MTPTHRVTKLCFLQEGTRGPPPSRDHLSCVAFCVCPLIAWKTFIFQTNMLLPSVEAGPNLSGGGGSRALKGSVVPTAARFHSEEPKQRRPGNINAVSFLVEQKKGRKHQQNTFRALSCMHVSVCLSTWRGKISTLHGTKRCKQLFSIAHRGRCCKVSLVRQLHLMDANKK